MNRPRDYVFVIAILAVGWAFWLQRMGINDHDDAVSNELLFARQSVAEIVTRNPWPDQSPLYFVVLHGVRQIGESPFAIELFNALLLTLTLAATYLLARTLAASASVARVALLLGAVSPASLFLVRSGRMYSIQVLLSALSLLAVVSYLEKHRPRALVIVAILCALNIYNHFAGFLITAVVFLPLAIDAWAWTRQSRRAVSLAALAVVVIVSPQIYRLILLLGHAPAIRGGLSAPSLSHGLLQQIGWFWFVNADWGLLRRGGRIVTTIYAAAIAILAVAGFVALRRRYGLVAAIAIVVPLLVLGPLAGRMDIRLRYFVWMLPILWTAVAAGAFGRLPAEWTAGGRAEQIDGFRRALAVVVIAGSTWLLWHKLPERYPEWTKLMMALDRVYRPPMRVYMPPGPAIGTPRFLVDYLHLQPGLRDVQPLSTQTRAAFERQADKGMPFTFLVHWSYDNDELGWRTRYLNERGYRRTVLSVWGARAEVFSQHEIDLSRPQRVAAGASSDAIVSWARAQLRESPHVKREPRLQDALVASVAPDGIVHEAGVFSSQRGEDGSWWLGEDASDVVDDRSVTSGGDERQAVIAHPRDSDTLVVAFPAVEMKRTLRLAYGLVDSALRLGAGADVRMTMYVDDRHAADLLCPNAPGWHELTLDTAPTEGAAADVVLLIAGSSEYATDFALQLATSSRIAPALRLDGGRTLRNAIDQLTVYRLSDGARIYARHQYETQSAIDMHEAPGRGGVGAVERYWVLGPPLWDAVGSTRQRSGGDARYGLWAHPRAGTTLVLEGPALGITKRLRGYFGFTDFAVSHAAQAGVTAPVRFRVLLDGATLVDAEAPRKAGWSPFEAAVTTGRDTGQLRVEISSAIDSWAHFVFDLWSN